MNLHSFPFFYDDLSQIICLLSLDHEKPEMFLGYIFYTCRYTDNAYISSAYPRNRNFYVAFYIDQFGETGYVLSVYMKNFYARRK